MIFIKAAERQKPVVAIPVNVAGVYRPVQQGMVKVAGVWKPCFQAYKALRYAATCNNVAAGNQFHYELISRQQVDIVDGDRLVYEVYPGDGEVAVGIDAMLSPKNGGMDFLRNYGDSYTGQRPPHLQDQNGRSIHSQGTGVSTLPKNQWSYREFDLSGIAPNTITQWAVVQEADTPGNYVTLYRFIHVVDKTGNVKATIFDMSLAVTELTPMAGLSYNYSAVSKTVVTAPV